jgi:hypothetical protein
MKHIHTFDEFLIEGKLELNKTVPTSTKQYTWIYQTGKDSSKTAIEISKKLNGMGIASFISKTTGDTIAIPTGDLEKAFDEVISAYDNMKQFAYTDGTKINKKIVNEQTLAFESFLNEGSVTYKVGDEFDPFGLAYWKNSPKPHWLEEYKGFHPNIMEVTVTLRITKIDGDELIFNDGEYQINKKDFAKTKI